MLTAILLVLSGALGWGLAYICDKAWENEARGCACGFNVAGCCDSLGGK